MPNICALDYKRFKDLGVMDPRSRIIVDDGRWAEGHIG